jgi:excisionase family DNA binding protein
MEGYLVAELMTLEEVASYLRVTEKTIYRLLDKRSIPATRVGHLWRFDKASIDAWLNLRAIGTGEQILVVDDDNEICTLFKDTLESEGCNVTTINDPREAFELVKKVDYSLLFLDLKMPEMDGVELLRQIRTFKPEMPVIVITGYPDGDLMMRALDYGPLGVMKKPFKASDVVVNVKNYLRVGMPIK